MTIKAIETRYKGYRFRSRLEARWAVFFDALGVPWEYEKQGYKLPSGPYLPDFCLPTLSAWFEVKPDSPDGLEARLAAELADATGHTVYVFYGPVPGFQFEYGEANGESAEAFFPGEDGGWDNFHAFCVCPDCGKVGIEFSGRSDRLPCKECYRCAHVRRGIEIPGLQCRFPEGCSRRCPRHSGNLDKHYTYDHPRILAAVDAARSARFEHGERGPG